ncbi:MAG: hypothetical protein V3575_00350 [Candidatus Absconditabacteria bacterium]
MQNQYFNIVVKKILKSRGKVINSEKIKKIINDILESQYSDKKCYKIIYHLKNRGYLISLKKDIFYVKTPEDEIKEEQLVDQYYWTVLKSHCEQLGTNWYIGGGKALELNMLNYDIPQEIEIINPFKQSKESVLSGKFIKFKKYTSGENNLFKKMKKFTNKIKIGTCTLQISNIENSILESLYNPDYLTANYHQELIKKLLRKHKKTFNFKMVEEIMKTGKHHSSINRLYKIGKSIDPDFANEILKIIKKYSFVLDN